MKKYFEKMFCRSIALGLFWAASANGGETDFEQDRMQLLRNLHDTFYTSGVRAPLKDFQPDGTWSDVDYQDHSRGSNWSPQKHLSRMQKLASSDPGKTILALQSWVKINPSSPNWWWPCIGIPQALCKTILVIGPDRIPPELLTKLEPVIRYKENNWKYTGQNLVWIAGIRLMTGVIYHDAKLVEKSRKIILAELRIAPEGQEGLQDDMSFHQHGTQNQIGNYGMSFLADQLTWAEAFKGTSFAYTEQEIGLLDRYFMESVRWPLMDGIMDYNYCGRQMWKGSPQGKYRGGRSLGMRLMKLVPAERRELYRAWLKNPDLLTGAAVFPRSAGMICRSPDGWVFSLKMCSPCIQGSETVNAENSQGLYQGDGVTFFGAMRRYPNYPALYDQRRLPGTTEVQDRASLCCRKIRNTRGYYALAGAFPYAIAALRMDADDIQADKVWFCTPSGITCSGSGIRSERDFPVVTTVDQYAADSEKDFPVEYSGKNIRRPVCTRTGNWKDSFGEFPSRTVTGKVVTLSIDHGTNPRDAIYCYTMRKKGVKAEKEYMLQTSSPRIHALKSGKRILIAAFVAGSVVLPDGKQLDVSPGIALCASDGKMLQQAAFRIR